MSGVPAENSAVLSLNVGGVCTGTLLAPNLVLTAKHCVATLTGTFPESCAEDGGLASGAVYFGTPLSPDAVSIAQDRGAHVSQILLATGDTDCVADMAMLVLDRAVDDPVIAPIRLDRPPILGESVTAIGWGFVSQKNYPAQLQKRAATILQIGPQPSLATDAGSYDAVPNGFFQIGQAICYGDSGSPLLSTQGAVVGVANSGEAPSIQIGTGTAADCLADDARGNYQATNAERDFILSGFTAAGATPWLEGESDPRAALTAFGGACANDTACASNVCATNADGTSACTQGCAASRPCPSGYVCGVINDRDRCVPAPSPPDAGSDASAAVSSGGCAVARGPASSARWAAVLLAILLTVSKFSRMRVQSHSRRSGQSEHD